MSQFVFVFRSEKQLPNRMKMQCRAYIAVFVTIGNNRGVATIVTYLIKPLITIRTGWLVKIFT